MTERQQLASAIELSRKEFVDHGASKILAPPAETPADGAEVPATFVPKLPFKVSK
jgi:hypothetical protein